MKTLTQDQLRCLDIIRFFREDENRWTTGCLARNEFGFPCSPTADAARKFCFLGAWKKLYGEQLPELRDALMERNDKSETFDEAVATISRLFDLP